MLPFNRRWRKKFGLPFKRSKFKFFLGDTVKTAHLHLRKTYANVFLTLTDLNNKVIICRTSGSSGIYRLRRRKASPYALEKILKKLWPHFRFLKIKCLKIFMKMRINSFAHSLLRYLVPYGIQIVSYKRFYRVAHNGVRQRRLARK